jgi:hypothetical protein
MNLLLTGILLVNLMVFGCLVAAFVYFRRLRSQITDIIVDFVTPPDEKSPSKLGIAIANISHIAGHAIAVEVKTTIMGKLSGESRLASGIEGDIVDAAMENSQPALLGLLDSVPGLKKRLIKNPALAGFIMSKLGNIMQPSGSVAGSNGHTSSGPKFKL